MPTIISANLKRLQKLKELTISQLAEKSGVSVRTIERIRTGKHVPDLRTISLLAKALGQKPEHLVEGAGEKCKANRKLMEKRKSFEDEIHDFTDREVKEILKRAKDPKSAYMTLEQAQAKLSEPERKRLAKDIRKTLEELERKDFTKFERELGKRVKCFDCGALTGKDSPVTVHFREESLQLYWCKTCDKAQADQIAKWRHDQQVIADSVKRQIIWAVCLTAAFLFGLYVLL